MPLLDSQNLESGFEAVDLLRHGLELATLIEEIAFNVAHVR